MTTLKDVTDALKELRLQQGLSPNALQIRLWNDGSGAVCHGNTPCYIKGYNITWPAHASLADIEAAIRARIKPLDDLELMERAVRRAEEIHGCTCYVRTCSDESGSIIRASGNRLFGWNDKEQMRKKLTEYINER